MCPTKGHLSLQVMAAHARFHRAQFVIAKLHKQNFHSLNPLLHHFPIQFVIREYIQTTSVIDVIIIIALFSMLPSTHIFPPAICCRQERINSHSCYLSSTDLFCNLTLSCAHIFPSLLLTYNGSFLQLIKFIIFTCTHSNSAATCTQFFSFTTTFTHNIYPIAIVTMLRN
jgi:hypothetical protein